MSKVLSAPSLHSHRLTMFSNSSPHSNPNPNFPQSSTSVIFSKFNRNKKNSKKWKKKKKKKKTMKKNKTPNWLELPEDVWFLILSKLKTIHIIENVQKVCMLFRKLCKQPSMFKIIDLTVPDAYMDLPYDVNLMTRYAVDRSCGCLVDIYMEYLCDDDTLMYIAERSKNLKHLRLGHYIDVSDEGLIEAVKMLPELEEVEIIICSFCEDTFEAIGHTCPSLKSFTLNDVGSKTQKFAYNEQALAIAKSMPNLRALQLIGNSMTNEGLKAILDGCPLLESLDLRACFLIDISGDLGKRCEQVKRLRQPDDSTSDYSHQACSDSERFGGYSPHSPYDSDSDSELFCAYSPYDSDFERFCAYDPYDSDSELFFAYSPYDSDYVSDFFGF